MPVTKEERLRNKIKEHKKTDIQRQQELANLRKVEQAALDAELGSVKKDKDGNIVDDASAAAKWAKFDSDAKMLIERGQEGYDSFVSAMTQVIKICRSLNEAIQASNPVGSVVSAAKAQVQSILDSRQFKQAMEEADNYDEANWQSLQEEAARLGLHIDEEPDARPDAPRMGL